MILLKKKGVEGIMNNTLGGRIAEHRKKKGMTQDQLAEYMGVSGQAVSKWENDLSCPDITALPLLSDCFGITIDELLRGGTGAVQLVAENERKDFTKLILRMTVLSSDGDIVNINLPVALIQAALDIGVQMPQLSGKDSLKNIDFKAVLMAAEAGVMGNLLEVKSADNDIVKIFIE